MRTDFSDYKFRSHAVGKLTTGFKDGGLTEAQSKLYDELSAKFAAQKITEKQLDTLQGLIDKKKTPATLGETAKSYLKTLHKEVLFNRRKTLVSKYLDKGIEVEEASISLYCDVVGTLFTKNVDHFENEYLRGTPDMTLGKVRDIKSSWDFDTFPLHEIEIPNSLYYWQLQAYLALTGLEEAELIYCLVDTPETLIEDEIRRTGWKAGFIDVPEDLQAEIIRNMTYSDIPKEFRVKIFKVAKNQSDIDLLYKVIKIARVYLNELSLSLSNSLMIES